MENASERAEPWQVALLDVTSTAIAVLAMLWGAVFFFTEFYGNFAVVLFCVVVLIVPAIRAFGFERRRMLFVLAFLSLPLVAGGAGGATVGSSTGALMAVVAAGTLYGARRAVLVWVLSIVLLGAGWTIAAHNPFYTPRLSDVSVGFNAARMLAAYTALSSVLLIGVVVVIRRLGESLRQAREAAEAELRARLEAASANERREQALRQMIEAQKYELMAQIAGTMAHDLNNSLQLIVLQAELLSRGTLPLEVMQAAARDIVEVSQQATSLTRQVLTLGKRSILDREVIDVGAELERMQRSVQRVLVSNVQLCVECQPGLRAYVDKHQLQQALLNLTLNAGHAMPDGGRLVFSAKAGASGMIELGVRDTGVGMDEETRAKIFEPFFTTKGSGGSGLGLAAVKAMVEQHGGQVQVETKPGMGTSFVLQLPAYHGEREANEAAPIEPKLHDRRILVVDDDPRVRRAMAEILSAAGARVTQAGTGDAASTLVLSERFDVLCTDAIMPGMPARELIDRFRARHPGAPVVVCSAYVESELLRRGIETESIAFLAKPFSAAHLLAKLHTVLQPTAALRDASTTS